MFLSNLKKIQKSAFYALATSIIYADDIVVENEKALMNQYLEEMKLNRIDLELMTVNDAVDIFKKSEKIIQKQVYIELLGLVMCDANFDKNEQSLLDRIASDFAFSNNETERMKACVVELIDLYVRIEKIISE